MTHRDEVLPGEHPHQDQANWHSGENIEDYLQNVREGLEDYSERRVCELMGWTRAHSWRVRKIGELPIDLFERLISLRPTPTLTELAYVAQRLPLENLEDGLFKAEFDCCPDCGRLLRARLRIQERTLREIRAWAMEKVGGTS